MFKIYRFTLFYIFVLISTVAFISQSHAENNIYFNKPDLINAFYSGETLKLQDDLLANLTYVAGIQEFLSSERVLFIVENRNLITEIDPTLSHEISKRIMTNKKGMDQAINAGLQSFLGPLMAIAETRKNGGSVYDEVNAANKTIVNSPLVMLKVIKKQSVQDAQRLAILYDSDPETFRRIYNGMQKFVMEI